MANGDDNKEPPEETDPTALRAVVSELAGIADVEVDLRADGSPHIRVKLDGSVPADDVGAAIREAVALARVRPREETESSRRGGLGRGLADVIAAQEESALPSQLVRTMLPVEPRPAPTLALVAVEETAGGISVRAADSVGGISFSPVTDPRSLNQAIVSAVARLRRERPTPRLAGVEIRDVNGSSVLTVVLALADGRRLVGAALVDRGMPFTLGKAVWEALASAEF